MSKSNDQKFDLDAAKRFAIEECAPTKKRDFLAKQAVWELYRELEKEHAESIELEIEEDDAELENELASKVDEPQSIFKEIVNQAKALGVAGVMTITTGVYFQTQAVYENTNSIISEIQISRTENIGGAVSSSGGIAQSISEAAEKAAETAATNRSNESQQESKVDTSANDSSAEESSTTESTTEESQVIAVAEESTSEPEVIAVAEESTSEPEVIESVESEDTSSNFDDENVIIEPFIIDIPLPIDVEIASDKG